MNVVHVASECAPWAATGGLAEVVAALPDALLEVEGGVVSRCSVVIPGYKRAVDGLVAAGHQPERVGDLLHLHLDGRTVSFAAFVVAMPGADLWLLTNIELFDRDGLYGDDTGSYGDNALRFVAFCHAARSLILRGDLGSVDLVHCHDWHAAALPVLNKVVGGPPTVLTIHNLGYQGVFDRSWLSRIGLPMDLFTVDGLEFHGRLNLLKGGVQCCDALTTVSPKYAEEILTEKHGAHLDGVLRHHSGKLRGILNGIGSNWDPQTDDALPANYSADDLAGKAACRDKLCAQLGLQPQNGELVFGIVSRLAWQKGLDLVADIAPGLASRGVLAVVGSGDPTLEQRFRQLQQRLPGRVGIYVGYSPPMARLLFAGSDALLMPSRYEPCGLAQLQAMRYGALPIVHATGGLADSVAHGHTGFAFEVCDGAGLSWGCTEALAAHAEPDRWAWMQQNAMRADFTWRRSAGQHVQIYSRLVG